MRMMMKAFSFSMFIIVLFPVSCGDDLAPIKKLVPPQYDRLKKWSDGETEVFMFIRSPSPHATHRIRLIVSSPEDIQVYYRANVNSGAHYSNELKPTDRIGDTIKAYDFTKDFTRTSCWFALDFKKNGKLVEALANSFYGGFDKKFE
jgi:hypothetical protein